MRPSPFSLIKLSTKIAGLIVHPAPLPALHTLYHRTLSSLTLLPPSYIYRTGTEASTKHRLNVLETIMLKHGAQEEFEREMGVREVEELVKMAEGELGLVGKVLEWKAWEPLQVQPPPGQWAQTKLGE
ncbi:NADH2 dehydrogenase [Mrakia frigida]|uniref:complex I NDUFA5 subunit family protein n=1 Tax=Mrakia frigida TaxID=29902 RepID=UPI003FCC17EB